MADAQTSLRELAALFLRLGTTAFGGPAVHIAMMHDEVVTRRKWLTEEHFLDLLGATNLIPGPSSTELAIHIGWERRRFAGLLVAGVSFIVPAVLITLALAWTYVRYGSLPAVAWLLYGVKPVLIGVIVQAISVLAPKAAKTRALRGLFAVSVLAAVLSVNELLLLFGAGAVSLGLDRSRRTPRATGASLALLAPAFAATTPSSPVTLPSLFWVFAKIGSVLFGSGYVLLAFLRADLVVRLRWLTEAQLIDAIAIGQLTPGPVFTTATFIGYLLAGTRGGLVATVGIFLPAFVFVALSGPLLPRLRASRSAAAFLDGVNVASLALMTVVAAQLGRAALIDAPTVVLAAISAVALVRFKVSSVGLVLAGAAAGFLLHAAGLLG